MLATDFWSLLAQYGPQIAAGALATVELTAAGMALSLLMGLILALMLISRARPMVFVARLYVEVLRGTPALVTLFLIYFGLAGVGLVLPPFLSAAIAFGVIGGAFMAEIFRAGIDAIDPGQVEAAKSMGMDYWTSMRRVVLPQAVRVVLPPITNSGITMLKDTSLVVTIGVPEITFRAYNIASNTYQAMPIYIIAGLTYLAMCYPLSLGVRRLESYLDKDSKAAAT
jgi:polar amino acid transport system permease protein